MPQFQRFDPSLCDFPRPAVPLLPTFRWSDLRLAAEPATRRVLDQRTGARRFARGRYALHAAYRAAGVGPRGTLLAPAYHCRTMLDPALALSAPVLLYPVSRTLAPAIEDIRALVARSTPAVRVLLVPHYFGWEQSPALMAQLDVVCRENDIVLIEDCSHAWQIAAKRVATGAAQRVLVASPYKFFASEEGGILWSSPARAGAQGTSAGLRDELKGLRSMWTGRRAGAGALPRLTGRPPAAQIARGADLTETSDAPSGMYARGTEGRDACAVACWVMRRTAVGGVVERRRANYRRWLAAVAALSGARALYPVMPADCAPYMFPLYLERPDPDFFLLKKMGLPIFRWDEMAVSECAVAADYRLRLLHLPCHQTLSEQQMQWMISVLGEVLR
ncbi:MAG: DegT/DnrJ/EryC1/StrS family aminotransferase [Pseudomonadota bacterium]|nr:DegT/DnrJ/EryC1/StrS family aminotransferase [Pseudomonadota bacterium]